MRETINTLTIGDHVPAFDLPAADGQRYSPGSFKTERLLVVIFLANHCPYVGSWEDRLVAIAREFDERGVDFVGISSNDPAKHPQDSLDEMRKRAENKHYSFPYLHDGDRSTAHAFGATRTPEVFVFDQERLLRYHGAIDSDYEESAGMQNYLRDALNRMVSGQEVFLPETPPLGCKIDAQD